MVDNMKKINIKNLLNDYSLKANALLAVYLKEKIRGARFVGKIPTEILKKFAEKYKADPSGWFFLTGPSETIETLRKSYGVEWTTGKDGKKRHTTIIALLDRKGDKAAVYNDSNYDTNKIVADIKNLLDGRPLQNIPVQQ